MPDKPELDKTAAHRYFSAACFNQAWDLMDKANRTPEEDETMLQLSMASSWHWSHRADVSATSRSIGFWQLSRIYVLLRQPENALRYGKLCLDASQEMDIEPFYLAYAHEAISRAELAAGHLEEAQAHLNAARILSDEVKDKEDRASLVKDLDAIQIGLPM
jgi:tetratricopeptide (TPR) repeat protein